MLDNNAVAVQNMSSFHYTIILIEQYVIVAVHQLPAMVYQPAIPDDSYCIMLKEV
jgi:hypothetical protein